MVSNTIEINTLNYFDFNDISWVLVHTDALLDNCASQSFLKVVVHLIACKVTQKMNAVGIMLKWSNIAYFRHTSRFDILSVLWPFWFSGRNKNRNSQNNHSGRILKRNLFVLGWAGAWEIDHNKICSGPHKGYIRYMRLHAEVWNVQVRVGTVYCTYCAFSVWRILEQ